MEDFIEAVSNMRKLQREYFRTRSTETLQAAKKAESKVDNLLHRIDEPNLFDG